jgi:class 3 adenylate cyclase
MEKTIPHLFNHSAEKRKLAAVMFADIEGYTALFQQHEQAALDQINTHRSDLQQLVESHGGQIIKYYGDGSLTVFNSVIEAMQCAIGVQQASITHSIPLRIGIHMGELIEKENDVYGDAVNIASRIQAIGIPGSILVSHTVANELKNHPNTTLHPLGEYELKNVRKPVSIYAVHAPGLIVPQTLHVPRHLKSRSWYYWTGSLVMIGIAAFFLQNIISPLRFRGEDCFIVPPFLTDVQDSAFHYFPQTIASYIGKSLRESAGVNIISERTLSYYTNANVANAGIAPSMARKAGARYSIDGHFGLEGSKRDTLRIWMSIIDLRTGAAVPISIPDVLHTGSL